MMNPFLGKFCRLQPYFSVDGSLKHLKNISKCHVLEIMACHFYPSKVYRRMAVDGAPVPSTVELSVVSSVGIDSKIVGSSSNGVTCTEPKTGKFAADIVILNFGKLLFLWSLNQNIELRAHGSSGLPKEDLLGMDVLQKSRFLGVSLVNCKPILQANGHGIFRRSQNRFKLDFGQFG
jgi:hypothetical protein